MEKIDTDCSATKDKVKFVPKGFASSEFIAIGQVVPPPVPTHTVFYAEVRHKLIISHQKRHHSFKNGKSKASEDKENLSSNNLAKHPKLERNNSMSTYSFELKKRRNQAYSSDEDLLDTK